MQDVYEYLKANQSVILADVERLVRQDSPSNRKDLVDACGDILTSMFQENLNIKPSVVKNDSVGDHLLLKIGSGKTKILLLGHFDTVWDPGVLTFRIEGNRAYGPGIFDMKAGIVQGMWALKAIEECDKLFDAEVTFLLTSDEETGSGTSRELIESEAKNADVVLVLEPSVGKTGAIKTSRKGTMIYRIGAHGIAAHAGNHPEDGASAIHELCRQVTTITGLQNPDLGTTINIGTFHGGTRVNVVADTAKVEVDVRITASSEVQRLEREFSNLKAVDNRVKLDIDGGLNRPPMVKSEQTIDMVNIAKNIARTKLGFVLTEASVGGGSDGNFTSYLGVPTLDGLGAVGDGPHAEHEHIVIEGLSQRSALLAELMLGLSSRDS